MSLDYEPGVARRDRAGLPGWATASAVTSASAIAMLAIGLWDEARGGSFLGWLGLFPAALGVIAIWLGVVGTVTGPLRIVAAVVTVFSVLVTCTVGKTLAMYWAG